MLAAIKQKTGMHDASICRAAGVPRYTATRLAGGQEPLYRTAAPVLSLYLRVVGEPIPSKEQCTAEMAFLRRCNSR